MKQTAIVGIIIAVIGIVIGAILEGANPMAIINIPAICIVILGTLGVVLAGTSMDQMMTIPKLYILAIMGDTPDKGERVKMLVSFAERARREGLLALDDEIQQIDDTFTKKGMQLVVDGNDPDLVAEILESEVAGMAKRHAKGADLFEKAAGFGPTMGIIGTVYGLINVLGNLDKPEMLGPLIAGAFIATLIGVASANVVYYPIANRLKGLSKEEQEFRTMTLEGILAIQAGDNPRVLTEKLLTYIPPSKRAAVDPEQAGNDGEMRAAA